MIRFSKMLSAYLVVAMTVAGWAGTGLAQERREVPAFQRVGVATEEDKAAVDALLADFRQAWAAQDAKAVAALHSPDTEWINAYARLLRGNEALGGFLQKRLFPAFPPGVAAAEIASMKPISIRFLGTGAAVVHVFTEGDRGPSRVEGEALRRTHMHFVLEKREGRWLIVHTAIMDAR